MVTIYIAVFVEGDEKMEFKHFSVMLKECLDGLNINPDGIYVDCTLGGAGHSSEILKRLSTKGRLIGIDQDLDALSAAKEKLKDYSNVTFVHNNFYNLEEILKDLQIDKIDGILMDLGVSSYQLDEAERGFSYMKNAPLDMRMDRTNPFSAYNVINEYSEEELYDVIKSFGEEKFAKRIANFLVERRKKKPLETTLDLVDVITAAIPAKFRREGGHPAKRTFQAIRIEVNKELNILDKAISDAITSLKPEGRIAIITFHSLEDRIVKNKFRDLQDPCNCPKELPMCVCGKTPIIKIVNRKPIEASKEELELNSRSKSAKLRVAEKI
jgi:16S rRNA (cytosine1402-N4)-methyltransferase